MVQPVQELREDAVHAVLLTEQAGRRVAAHEVFGPRDFGLGVGDGEGGLEAVVRKRAGAVPGVLGEGGKQQLSGGIAVADADLVGG